MYYLLDKGEKQELLSFEFDGKKYYLTKGETQGEFVNLDENVEKYGLTGNGEGISVNEYFATKIQNSFAKGLNENESQYTGGNGKYEDKKYVKSSVSTE